MERRGITHGRHSRKATPLRLYTVPTVSGPWEAQAAEISPRLFELCPWVEDVDAIAIAMARFLLVEARSLILESSMAEIIATAGPGKVPIRMWEQANATDRLAGDLGRKLGLNSAGLAQLRQSEASTQSSLADLAATGRVSVNDEQPN